ncbi:radical SAM protein [Kistimonas asteriae]|uniref:radical SAM protein n=1 Tax=Kistimonas asteriae TaxID=517724 RepID=UPI001BA7F344|nr:radical SAM protein [Kistimonas asteriae]
MMLTVARKKDGLKLECYQQGIAIRLDGMGYWCSYRNTDAFYRRCVDGGIVVGRESPVVLSVQQGNRVIEEVLDRLRGLVDIFLSSKNADIPEDSQISSLMQCATRRQLIDYHQRAQLARAVYPEPVPILPPDRYGDIVLQPATGCPNAKCTFCAFYQGKRFLVLSDDELKSQISQVKALFSPGWGGRDGVFLGSANAMALSTRRLLSTLQLIQSELGGLRRGVAAFGDADFAPARKSSDWSELAGHGLRQVILGLETGDGKLRARLGKSSDLSSTLKMVAALKEVGIRVGITILTGIGEGSHIERTLSFVKHLPLEREDIIYLSPLEESSIKADADKTKQFQALLSGIRSASDARVVPYQMKRFFYYA